MTNLNKYSTLDLSIASGPERSIKPCTRERDYYDHLGTAYNASVRSCIRGSEESFHPAFCRRTE